MMKLEQAIERAIDRCNLIEGDCDIYRILYQYKAIRELPDEEIDEIYNTVARALEFTDNKEDKSMMTMKNTFTFDGRTYETNEKGNYFYVTDLAKNYVRKRISQSAYEQAFEQYVNTSAETADAEEWAEDAEAEIKARKDLQDKKDREAEEAFNKPTRKEVNEAVDKAIEKEMKKPRRSKDVAFEMDTLIGHVTLTIKQVDFIKHLPDTSFWEHGLDSTPWCDCLADEIGGQFTGKPMTVGAMISTLREKKLVEVVKDTSRQGNPKYMVLTEVGKVVANKLGLN